MEVISIKLTYKNHIIILNILFLICIATISALNPKFGLFFITLFTLIYLYFFYRETLLESLMLAVIIFVATFNISQSGYYIITLVLIVFLFNRLILNNRKIEINFRISYNTTFFSLWLFIAGFQLILLEHTESTSLHIKSLVYGIVTILILTNLIREKRTLVRVYMLWALFVALTLIIGIWEVNTGNHFRSSTAYPNGINATVGFYNPNDYSFFLSISLPLSMYFFQKNHIYKLFAFFMFVSSVYLIYINGSRSVLISILLLIVLYLIYISRKSKKTLIFALTTFSTIFIVFYNPYIVNIFNQIETLGSGDSSISTRKQLLISGLNIFKENPLFGVGPGNIEFFMPVVGDKVHNFWLEILVNYGLFIFIGFLFFFVRSLIIMMKNRSTNLELEVKPIFWSSIIFIITSLTSSTIFTFHFLWYFLGMIVVVTNLINSEKQNYIKLNSKI